ncbi:2a protein [Cassia yellow blotch virus]|uniref:RNA-directed RNA polymerase 2a n=1 Tax=Cassia yellow blotch virus TaxID=300879 RepID=Q50L55_9BROM|nr:2a protein [Cassia yellow blotch virus]BAD98317.2 2a protein [Cassia yellow blotch virus]
MSRFINGEEYEIPSFQWLIDESLERLGNLPAEISTDVVDEPRVEITAEGTLDSFLHAVKPLVISGEYQPPFDQARWASCCQQVYELNEAFGHKGLIPPPEMARMLYLDIEGSFINEEECDDWMPVDTDDGYLDYTSKKDLQTVNTEENDLAEMPELEECSDSSKSDVVEFTLADRFQVTSGEFFDLENSNYQLTLDLQNPMMQMVEGLEDTLPETEPDEQLTLAPRFTERVSCEALEGAGHRMLPTHAYFDDSHMQALEEIADYNLDFERIKISQSGVDWYKDPDKYYEPKMQIGSFSRRVGTQKTVLTALKKRNADVPELADNVDIQSVAAEVSQRFFETFLNPGCENLFRGDLNVMAKAFEYEKKWSKHKDLVDVNVMSERNLQSYKHMIKTDVKPVINDTLHLERAVPATITFHGKAVTSAWSPFFTSCFENLILHLRSRFIVPVGKLSSLEIKNMVLNDKYFLEADLSKFDKSQGELHLEFQREILLKLGFPAPLANWWSDFHRQSYLSDKNAGVGIPVSFQRRTGDAFTYFGNTLVTMSMMAYCYDLSKMEYCFFSGDDSLLISREKHSFEPLLFQSLFNMEIKVMEPSLPYICSKYLLETTGGRVVSVPDPVREIQRMSKRKIVKDPSVLRAHYVSFCDRMKFLKKLDEKSLSLLCKYCCLRQRKPDIEMDVRIAVSACGYYAENFARYAELFVTNGAEVFMKKNPCKPELPERSDGSWFRDWRNTVFPRLADSYVRFFGRYSVDHTGDYESVVKSCKAKAVKKLWSDSYKAALDRRDDLNEKIRKDLASFEA